MKNTPENKAKFFAQYWGQKVGVELRGSKRESNENYSINEMTIDPVGDDYLELKSLSQITDEDAIEVFHISKKWNNWMYRKDTKKLEQGRQIIKDFMSDGIYWYPKMLLAVSDFLRSRGYALPWMGISVEEQVEFGWIKPIDQ